MDCRVVEMRRYRVSTDPDMSDCASQACACLLAVPTLSQGAVSARPPLCLIAGTPAQAALPNRAA